MRISTPYGDILPYRAVFLSTFLAILSQYAVGFLIQYIILSGKSREFHQGFAFSLPVLIK